MQRKLCPICNGRGTATPTGNLLTMTQLAEAGTNFEEDLNSGTYDLRCQCCGGFGVVYEASLEEEAELEEWARGTDDYALDYYAEPDLYLV